MSGWLMNAKNIPSTFGRDDAYEGPTPAAQRCPAGSGAPSRSMILQEAGRLRDYGRGLMRRKSTSVAAW